MDLISKQKLVIDDSRAGDRLEFNGVKFIPMPKVDTFKYEDNSSINLNLERGDTQVVELPSTGESITVTCTNPIVGRTVNIIFKQSYKPVLVLFDRNVFKSTAGSIPSVTTTPKANELYSGVCMEDGKIYIFKISTLEYQ
jgi:hypothetical protein